MSMYDRADIYDLRSDQRVWDAVKVHMQELLKDTDIQTILDCSIGSGNLTLGLAELGYEVTGSDLSETMLQRCRIKAEERGLKVELYQSDFREVEKNVPGTYDCVMSTGNSLPYVSNEDVVLTLGKMDKLVKPGGYLCYEFGEDQGDDICEILRVNGFVVRKRVSDYNGTERALIAQYCAEE